MTTIGRCCQTLVGGASLLLICAVLFPMWTGAAQSSSTETGVNPKPERPQIVWADGAEVHELSPGKGWILTQENIGSAWAGHVYWTNNDGADWTEITPHLTGEEYINQVTFLDESHGWVSITPGADMWDDARLAIRKNGRWFSAPANNSYGGMKSRFTVQFVDAQRGWMTIYSPTSPAVDPGPDELAVTSDGGLTWRKLPQAPTAGQTLFLTREKGLLIGPVPEEEQRLVYWATRDHGVTWKLHPALPMPKGFSDWELFMGRLSIPQFEDARRGTWIVPYVGPGQDKSTELEVTYATSDGGGTWKISEVHHYGEGNYPGIQKVVPVKGQVIRLWVETSGEPASIFPSINRASSRIVISRNGADFASADLPTDMVGAFPLQVSFADERHGWIVVSAQRCREWCGGSPEAALEGLKKHSCRFACRQFSKGSEILSTSDGGHTWKAINPTVQPR